VSADPAVSALLPVHRGVATAHLLECVHSLLAQTRELDEIVVIEDGPLETEQLAALDRLETLHPQVLRLRLPVNQGAGVANQVGLNAASSEWILKADADDISVPHRLETQLAAATSANVDACGAAMLEFRGTKDNVVALRSAPTQTKAIQRRMRWNNPMNHPTVIYRRDVALSVGGYPSWRYMQDYGLFARMAAHGAVLINLDEPCVWFRASDAVTSRRKSADIRRLEVALQRELRSLGLIGWPQAVLNVIWRATARMLPSRVFGWVQRRVLAKPMAGERS
jgi:glycosyltransferase involved in cell wall biosynthesis